MWRSISTIAMLWAVPLFGCAQVLDIEDWNPGGQGGAGGAQSTSAGPGVQASAVGSTTATGSTTTGTSGQGGGTGCDGPCVDALPPDWTGPVTLMLADKGTPLPDCGSDWPAQTDWQTGALVAPQAGCGGCDCGPPTGGQCALTQVSISVYGDGSCGTTTATTPVTMPNTCVPINLGTIPGSSFTTKLTGQSLPYGSTCAPMGAPPTIEPAYFEKVARMCGDPAVATTCENGAKCLPPLPGGFSALCIYRQVPDGGNVSCPAGYLQRLDLYTGIMDSRGCSACTCGSPFAQNCEMNATLYYPTCATAVSTIYPGACHAMNNTGALFAKVYPGQPQAGDCLPSTPNPTGEARGMSRTAVCCVQ